MSDIFTKLKDINPLIETVIDPGTTGYTSDAYEDDEENNNRISSLSLSEVKTYIIDERVIGILPENSYVCDVCFLYHIMCFVYSEIGRRVIIGECQSKPKLLFFQKFFYETTVQATIGTSQVLLSSRQ